MELGFVRLDPYSEGITRLFIHGMKTTSGVSISQLLFADYPQRHSWIVQQVYYYTGSVILV